MTKEYTCCFTGPRSKNLPLGGDESTEEIAELKEKLYSAIEDAYAEGYRSFMSGMAEGFDIFAAEAVLRLKETRPDVSLVCVFPCPASRDCRNLRSKERLERIVSRASLIIYVENSYVTGCEHLRNIYMADNSCRIIGWYNGLSGGTAHCWNYALSAGLEMINLFE